MHVFPICIGETGSKCLANPGSNEVIYEHFLDSVTETPGLLSKLVNK
jgi:hypothetical protein